VDLPLSSAVQVERDSIVAVTVQDAENGIALFVDREPVSLDGLARALRIRYEEQEPVSEREIQLFADKTVSYQDLFLVMDRIKEAGFNRISLQAEVQRL
ncbi:MAG: biopolymer transporter ExbD, partial [Desulfobulbaceae bacterium]|nr:biopolymer transporter ExbD [Desulfobulbaceae bacterium]